MPNDGGRPAPCRKAQALLARTRERLQQRIRAEHYLELIRLADELGMAGYFDLEMLVRGLAHRVWWFDRAPWVPKDVRRGVLSADLRLLMYAIDHWAGVKPAEEEITP